MAIINYILGIVLGGFWAFGFAFLEEYVDESIHSPSDLKAILPLPFLGLLPEAPRSGQTRSVGGISENPLRLERMRRIRNRLAETRNGDLPKSLSVTSTTSGEGKSYLIANLATILANEGLRVLAVDMNLRTPSLANLFGAPQGEGLGGYLDGTASLDDIICSTDIERLDLLSAGKMLTDPAMYLVSRQLPALIEELQRSYDIVLIDTPALRDYEDAVSISGLTEAIIFVIAAGKTPSPNAKKSVERLQLAGRAITGTVMNRMDPLQYKQLR